VVDRQSKKSWLDAALKALASGGIDRVRVESLAKNLGVTKGSFYWHFKDREQFLDELLNFWAEQSTQTVIANPNYPTDSKARVRAVAADIVRHDLGKLDPHIRSWTQYDKRRARVVAKIDKVRFEFLRDLFLAAGFSIIGSDLRAQSLYRYVLGEQFISVRESMSQRLQRMQAHVDLLLQA
jgi:AcrR family transcriptional regulator